MLRLQRRLPRGINFLLGGVVATVAVLALVLSTGGFNINIGGAPDVRIDAAAAMDTR